MQRKTKNFLTKSIIVLLICSAAFYVALHVRIDGYAEKDKEKEINENQENEIPISEFVEPEDDPDYGSVVFNFGEFLDKDIYINGCHINNWQLKDPFISVNNTVYIPMSDSVLAALGLDLDFSAYPSIRTCSAT